ncbi:uncharacterized protein AMSG_12362 [Thecamonas trahens ATCC 50062]|uniref:Uncharacterized protein n=1 Tax=Thecamonas trahens ATCC 50062 TaxID=461836 RepID=A0A0L0DTT0_THETB|nr:hypothetical protein AMSG_12362 [Thecamonas trahens ATCC 50062]KNC54883.1 hypothetical protein AMSG_12362 [Thecamonas trahens ATCC 50062]|eukprot:XP_013753526.1 hypothetical protein AMSG_12362 [Thecamonas trahens ATCC 50062]
MSHSSLSSRGGHVGVGFVLLLIVISVVADKQAPSGERLFLCNVAQPFDAAFKLHPDSGVINKQYVFKGNKVWVYDAEYRSTSLEGTIASVFPGLPINNIDAAVSTNSGNMFYVFKGVNVYLFDIASGLKSGFPKTIASEFSGAFPNHIDAVQRGDLNKIYAYKGSQVFAYHELTGQLGGFPKAHNLGFSPDAAIQSPFQRLSISVDTYYFVGNMTHLVESNVEVPTSPFPICSSCSGTKVINSGTSGDIAPFVDLIYTNLQTCKWVLDFGIPGYLTVDFINLETEQDVDVVTLYDGPSTASDVLSVLSGSLMFSTTFTTSTEKALVEFTSDGSTVASGFDISYEFYAECPTLSSLSFGYWSPADFGYRGQEVSAICCEGYTLTAGSTTRICTPSGTWSGTDGQTCTPNPCSPDLVAPANGYVSATTGNTGDTSNFGCNAGYTLVGSPSRTCHPQGFWSNSNDQFCDPNPCSPPQLAPTNGVVSSTSGKTGETIIFSCNSGYTLGGSSSRTCQPSGTWSNLNDQVCTASSCSPPLTPPANGQVSCTTGTTNDICFYSCNQGYDLSGSASRTCQANQAWTGSDPTCNPAACSPNLSSPLYGSVSSASGVTGQTSTFSCNAGYTLSGDASRTCQATGSWSNADNQVCSPLPCPALNAPTNGAVSITSGSVGDVASYSCNAGYFLSGETSRTCQVNQVWSSMAPTCEPLSCTTLAPLTNGYALPGYSGRVGDTIAFGCNAGYTFSGSSTRTCSQSQIWSGGDDQSCSLTPDYCPAQTAPVDGSLTSLTRTVGGSATFSCDSGFTLVGSASRTCQSDGSWSGTLPICTQCSGNCATCEAGQPTNCNSCIGGYTIGDECVSKVDPWCPPLGPPTNGSLSAAPCGRKVDDTCGVASCNAGYFLVGPSSRVCQSSQAWSNLAWSCATCASQCATCDGTAGNCLTCAPGLVDPPSCATPVTCPSLSPPANGALSTSVNTSGTTVSVSCSAGFTLSGSSTLECGTSGVWSGPVDYVCTGLPCTPPLSPPSFGTVSAVNGTTGEVRSYACNQGYSLVGDPTQACQADGSWGGSAPSCSASSCTPTLTPPTNGAVSATTGVTGDAVSYSCNAGFSIVGAATVTCLTNSSWSAAAPLCAANPCTPALDRPVNGSVSQAEGVTGDVATFACNTGYLLIGQASRQCQTDGTWSGAGSPFCDVQQCPRLSVIQPPPANGLLTCDGASFGSTCTIICNTGYSPFGTTSRTCLTSLAWSGDSNVLCSDAQPLVTATSFRRLSRLLQAQSGSLASSSSAPTAGWHPLLPTILLSGWRLCRRRHYR